MVEQKAENILLSFPFVFLKDLPLDVVLISICPFLPSYNNIKDPFLLQGRPDGRGE